MRPGEERDRPEPEEPERVHGVRRPGEGTACDQRHLAVPTPEVVAARSAGEPEVPLDRPRRVERRQQDEDGETEATPRDSPRLPVSAAETAAMTAGRRARR